MTQVDARRRWRWIPLALAVAAPLAQARAQIGAPGQIEVGFFGSLTSFDRDAVGLDSKAGAGARLAWFPVRSFSIEASGDQTITNALSAGPQVNVTRIGGTLLAHGAFFPVGTIYGGAGYGQTRYRGALSGNDKGLHAVLGDRLSLGGRTALRIEGRADFTTSSAVTLTTSKPVNLSANIGLSIFSFGGAPRDGDGDGVANVRDRCPDTPLGAHVDQAGCPTDADGDGALDGLDQCPDTPSGAFVDSLGCPTDADGDGVPDGIDVCPNTPSGATADANGCPVDGDEDGVFDGIDQCPDTPQGATVDAQGCPTDTDGDSVVDGLDRCPDTPQGTQVDATGCSVDADGDGVLNAVDQCPDTPPNTEVDGRGCPLGRDSDNDGIPDHLDRCPNTSPGQNVDAVGCPILFREEGGRRQPLILKGVNFATSSSALTTESYAVLNDVAASLLAHPEVRVEIAGHTDATGTRAVNTRLSRERALAVRAYLARRGVEPGRMEAVGKGPDEPIATNATRAGRAQNRRVELRVIEGGQQP